MIQHVFTQAQTHSQETLFFNPPLEARNPELVVSKHLPKPKLHEVIREKHVPLKAYLLGEDGGEAMRPKSAYSA